MDRQPRHGFLKALAEPGAVPGPLNGRRDDAVLLAAYARQLGLDIYLGSSKVIAPPSARFARSVVVLGLAPTNSASTLLSFRRAGQNHDCIGLGFRKNIPDNDFFGAD